MNRTLQRQLARLEGEPMERRFDALLAVVSATYDQHERDRKHGDRANALMADELTEMVWIREHAILLEAEKHVAIRSSLAKSQFLANMSHELRTPLNAIIGYSEIIEDEYTDSDNATLVEDSRRIQRAAFHLLGLINDILDHSKVEAGKIEIRPAVVQLRPLFDDVVEAVRGLATKNGNDLIVRCAPDIGEAYLDPLRLKQCLLNLASNAAKFTRKGRVKLEMTATEHDGVPVIQFQVSDTGIGMSEDVMLRLFQPFVQADSSITRDYGGTGLGLAITRKLIESMHGKVDATSELGTGSTFTLILPRASTMGGVGEVENFRAA